MFRLVDRKLGLRLSDPDETKTISGASDVNLLHIAGQHRYRLGDGEQLLTTRAAMPLRNFVSVLHHGSGQL
jgi:hypothetical protein